MISKRTLDLLYESYNSRKWVHPDPLEFLYEYPDPMEREIVGLIASSLAYGRVAQILKSVSSVLKIMGDSPRDFLISSKPSYLKKPLSGFKHRFTTSEHLVSMLAGICRVIKKHGSLYECFLKGMKKGDKSVLPALSFLVNELWHPFNGNGNCLLPTPEKGSACKKLNLFLRWMVRNDKVDPGGWEDINPSTLIIPLDTHMHRIGLSLGFTKRKSNDMRTAIEITESFKKIEPDDPVKFDFALTRLGIRQDADIDEFINDLNEKDTCEYFES